MCLCVSRLWTETLYLKAWFFAVGGFLMRIHLILNAATNKKQVAIASPIII